MAQAQRCARLPRLPASREDANRKPQELSASQEDANRKPQCMAIQSRSQHPVFHTRPSTSRPPHPVVPKAAHPVVHTPPASYIYIYILARLSQTCFLPTLHIALLLFSPCIFCHFLGIEILARTGRTKSRIGTTL